MITFDPNEASGWLYATGWTDTHDGLPLPEIANLVETASRKGIFGDVIVELHTEIPRFSMVTVTVKNPAIISRVASPDFDATAIFTFPPVSDHEAALTALGVVAEMAATALAPLTTYVVTWTGGYEDPSFSQHTTRAGADAQAAQWAADTKDGDEILILKVVAGSSVTEVVSQTSHGDAADDENTA